MIGGSIGARRLAARDAALGEPAGLPAQPRGRLPRQQPRPRRDGVRRLLGDVLAAHRRGADRDAPRARPTVVRSLHGAARARARPAERDWAGHRLAQGDRGQRAAQLRPADRARALTRRRARRVRRGIAAARARDVRLRRVRRCERRTGVLARDRGAPGDDRREPAGGSALARRPQPPALRRLPRPRRDGGAVHRRRRVDGVQRRARHPPQAWADGAGRRLRVRVRAADVADLVDERGAPGEDLVRLGGAGASRRQARHDAASRARLLPVARRVARSDRALLRGRGDERDRLEGRSARRRLGGDDARQGRPRAGDRAGRQGLRRHRRQAPCAGGGAAAWPGAQRPREPLRRGGADGDLPPHHLSARDVDLARRDHRLPRRARRDVAR